MSDDPAGWSGHTIVCGLSDVGLMIVEQLHLADRRVVVVDELPNPRWARTLEQWDVPCLTGDPRRPETLERSGSAHAAAVICTVPNDLINLEVALLTRELNPTVRLVVQLSNAAVGRAMTPVAGAGSVLDFAQLAAPAFVQECLALTDHDLILGGVPFVVTEIGARVPGTLRSEFRDLTPIAVVGADRGVEICPGRDFPIHVGDRVVVVGTRDQLSELNPPWVEQVRAEHDPGMRRITAGWQFLRGFVSGVERPMRLAVNALLGVAVLSVCLLVVGYTKPTGRHMSVLDSAYFTTETLTTVGFGDFYFANQPAWLRIWAIGLMILGATLVTILYALLTNYLVSRRIAESLGQRRVTGLRDHVILIGLGAVGLRVLEGLLASGRGVVIVERDDDNRFLGNARALHVPVIIGDATQPETLEAANLDHASAVAVLTSNDLVNIETGLAVEDRLGARSAHVPVVLRVFDQNLARTISRSFGFRHVHSTSALAAPWFVGAALGLDVLSTFSVERHQFLVGQLTVRADGGLDGRSMIELGARIRVLAIKRHGSGRVDYPMRRADHFAAGDIAYVVGPYDELLQVLGRQQAPSTAGS